MTTFPARARLFLGGYGGTTAQSVDVVAETRTRYRVRSADGEPVRLAGRARWIGGDTTALVPKAAVQLEASS